MDFSLDDRTASLSVGEFADFSVGPRDGGDGIHQQGIWRAQLGSHWHREMQTQATADDPAAEFEVSISGRVFHRGWTITLTGRIDQKLTRPDHILLREIKTVMRPVPLPEDELRTDYPGYFAQLATYLALHRLDPSLVPARGELVFVETSTGLSQIVPLAATADANLFTARLERVTEFLDLRRRARDRLRGLAFRPAFAELRPGQETTRAELTHALASHGHVAFEAPTGFGKTGVLLECALEALRAGRFARLVYLTSKSTGQLQVRDTLTRMTTAPAAPEPTCNVIRYKLPEAVGEELVAGSQSVALWHVRNKAEHCVNHTFHCVRDECVYLQDLEARWPKSGLSRFYLFENHPRDLTALRDAGRTARICPYEITRTALAFNDVWIGDYNYVFAPRNRTLFAHQPGWNPAETLLVIDEAHNLPSRVADAHSHVVRADDARATLAQLDHLNAPAALLRAWETYTLILAALKPVDALDLPLEEDLFEVLTRIGELVQDTPLDFAALGPTHADQLWRTLDLSAWIADGQLKKLLWCPRLGDLHFTCLDAAPITGEILRTFGGTILASATLSPLEPYAATVGLDPGELHLVSASTPWRDGAYDVAYDARVTTTYRERQQHAPTTAATIATLRDASPAAPVAVFFPSYAYADQIARQVDRDHPGLRVALQPRLPNLAAQAAWVEESLALADVIFLVLGSSFAEGIDLLGGRLTHAMVVGPALPEVNAVQRARLDAAQLGPTAVSREEAAHRVYRIPGLQKVNQALGRLIRAPGQRAKVLLHCRRFVEPAYASLLARDYQFGATLTTDTELADWLETPQTTEFLTTDGHE